MSDRRTGAALALLSLLVYLLVGASRYGLDSHIEFARAFLAGRLWIDVPVPVWELAPRPEGGWYSPFPPLPALTFVPLEALGIHVDTGLLAAVAGAASTYLVWSCLGTLSVERWARVALTVVWALGSQVLWIAGAGGQHLYPQILAAALLLGSLRLALTGHGALAAGLLLGLAATARLPVGLALPLLAYLYRERGWPLVIAGWAAPLALMAAYNIARFGDPLEFGYALITYADGSMVLDESWYPAGLLSIEYLPRSLHSMLLRGFDLVEEAPFVRPSYHGLSVLLTMPILLWAFGAPTRLAIVGLGTALLVLVPDLLHGNPGWSQFGYRYILDALPILWLLVGLALRDGLTRPALAALAVGSAVTIYGTAAVWLHFVA